MKIGNFDTDKEIMIIAEIGNNHEGDYNLAVKMLESAVECGVDAVKYQTYRTEHYVSKNNQERFNKLKSFELSYEEFKELSLIAKDKGIIFLSTPFDIKSAKFLNNIVPAFKISSSDNNFFPLIDTIISFNKPIIMSSGLTTLNQIKQSKEYIEKKWNNFSTKENLAILHCVSTYPVQPQEANLLAITTLKNEFNCTIGYSDHTLGNDASLISALLGARIIEKHFTINKNQSDFQDHKLSADPFEMTELVKKIRNISILLGDGKKILQKSEKEVVDKLRRRIIANKDIKKGEIINREDITWVRYPKGLPAGNEKYIVGKKTIKNIKNGEIILIEMVE